MMPDMTEISGKYWDFYIEGREARGLKHDIDIDDVAEKLRPGGATLRDAILAACDAAAKPLDSGKSKRTWIAERTEDIAEAGGNAEEAYRAWLKGRIDELAYMLEPEVINALAGENVEDTSDDDEEDED